MQGQAEALLKRQHMLEWPFTRTTPDAGGKNRLCVRIVLFRLILKLRQSNTDPSELHEIFCL